LARPAPEASVLDAERLEGHDQPLALGCVTILGRSASVAAADRAGVREPFLSPEPNASVLRRFLHL
jgi:hypothetical protein